MSRRLADKVIAVSANAVNKPLLGVFFGDQRGAVVDQLTRTLPVKQMGTSEDIADAAIFLMNNKYTTGTVLAVNGGILLI